MKQTLEVWAPRAKLVEVELVDSKKRLPMLAGAEGLFHLPASEIQGGYLLRLDGHAPIPDPRAKDVASVHGPCFLVDHTKFAWTDETHRPAPLDGAILYELHVGTFTPEGTFDAAAAKLPALKELGITHVELMPVVTFAGQRGWGYDGTAMFAPHRAYGGVDGLKRLVNAAHAVGLNMVLDVVFNHLGPTGNYLGHFGPYFHADLHTEWGGAVVNLDGPGSHEVRRFFLDNARHWIEHYHFDGLRLDAVHALIDRSHVHLLEQLARDLTAAHWPGVLIAESDLNDAKIIRDLKDQGYGMHAQWSDDLHHSLRTALSGETHGYYSDFADEPLALVARALEEGFVYQGQLSKWRGREHGGPLKPAPLKRLLAYSQTHDQVGNDARGRRLSHLVGIEKAKAAMALVMLSPMTPMLFMGEEWAASTPFLYFTDHQDPEVARATTEGRKRELVGRGALPEHVSDPQAPATFDKSKLDWSERGSAPHDEMIRFTRQLIAMRKRIAPNTPGKARADGQVLIYERDAFIVALNLGDSVVLPLPTGAWTLAVETGASMISPVSVSISAGGFAILGM